jgi:hypothetical protein
VNIDHAGVGVMPIDPAHDEVAARVDAPDAVGAVCTLSA